MAKSRSKKSRQQVANSLEKKDMSKKILVHEESESEEEVEEEITRTDDQNEEIEEEGDEDDEKSSDSVEQSSSDDDSEEDGDEQDVNALFRGSSSVQEDGDDSSDEEEGEEEGENDPPAKVRQKDDEQCTFDIRNMTAMNTHQIPANSIYTKKAVAKRDEFISIPLDKGHEVDIDDDFLLTRASAGCAQLVAAIWQLPTESSDAGPLATLPSYDEIRLPRALPPPPPKEETKWEKFAKAKGIPLNKEKRSRKVWDEATGSWMYRHGYEKANNSSKEWPIMEVGANDDPYDDPWEKLRDAKRARTERNMESRMKNEERAGNLAKGTTNRVMKSREKSRKNGKEAGNRDRDNILPTGVPVDLKTGAGGESKLRGKASTTAALEAVQRSTASLGKFDKMREGEPERKKVLSKIKKRRYESATERKVVNTEGEKSMKILNAVMNGGGVGKERAIRKGHFAKGETAYDYEYSDGLGAATFKKKKGRAGAGKMKKMTKKRVT